MSDVWGMRRLSLHSLLNCSNTTVSIQYSLCFISIKFAANIGIDFYTPEEFFLKEKPAPFDWPTFMPVCITQGFDGIITEGGYIQGKLKQVWKTVCKWAVKKWLMFSGEPYYIIWINILICTPLLICHCFDLLNMKCCFHLGKMDTEHIYRAIIGCLFCW